MIPEKREYIIRYENGTGCWWVPTCSGSVKKYIKEYIEGEQYKTNEEKWGKGVIICRETYYKETEVLLDEIIDKPLHQDNPEHIKYCSYCNKKNEDGRE